MQAAIKLTARVQPGYRIEICAPELPEGRESGRRRSLGIFAAILDEVLAAP